jgi:hypothetical protein
MSEDAQKEWEARTLRAFGVDDVRQCTWGEIDTRPHYIPPDQVRKSA